MNWLPPIIIIVPMRTHALEPATRPIWAPPGRGVQRMRRPTFVRAQTVLASRP